MVFIEFYAFSKVDDPGVISIKVRITVSTLSTSPYCLMSILLYSVPLTTKITILSYNEATAQRINAVIRSPPLGTMYENSIRNETLTLNFSIPIANIRKIKPPKCSFLT